MNRLICMRVFCSALFLGLILGVVANGRIASAQNQNQGDQTNQDRAKAEASSKQETPNDFDRARKLFQRRNAGQKLTDDEEAYLKRALEARRAQQNQNGASRNTPAPKPRETTGLKPLSEMTAKDRYKGEDGGLYGAGRNSPPDEQHRAAELELARIEPLDAHGKPATNGKIVIVSISMSNATQEFSKFKRIADTDEGSRRK